MTPPHWYFTSTRRARPAACVSELVTFYWRGATVSPPRRACDESRWWDRALVLAHIIATACVLVLLSAAAFASLPAFIVAALFVWLGHVSVDPVNGLVHFALDNYFSRTSAIVGGVVDGFLNHHDEPATITRIQLARNVSPIMAVCLPPLVALIVARPEGSLLGLAVLAFGAVFFAESGFSMEAHKYAHIGQAKLPSVIRALQRGGWLVPPQLHAEHHVRRPGHESDYAAVTGKANRYLTPRFFRRVERVIYECTKRLTGVGVEPRSWCDPAVRNAALVDARRPSH